MYLDKMIYFLYQLRLERVGGCKPHLYIGKM